jgi:hypothetical protein
VIFRFDATLIVTTTTITTTLIIMPIIDHIFTTPAGEDPLLASGLFHHAPLC